MHRNRKNVEYSELIKKRRGRRKKTNVFFIDSV
jgi:hypothetical protein